MVAYGPTHYPTLMEKDPDLCGIICIVLGLGSIVDSRAQLEEHNPWAWKVLIGCVLNLLRPMLTYVLLEMMRAREAERGFCQCEIGREVWGWWGREVIWGYYRMLEERRSNPESYEVVKLRLLWKVSLEWAGCGVVEVSV